MDHFKDSDLCPWNKGQPSGGGEVLKGHDWSVSRRDLLGYVGENGGRRPLWGRGALGKYVGLDQGGRLKGLGGL